MKLLRMVGKPPDCDSRSVDRNRIHDNVHACAVLQTGVDDILELFL